MSLEAQLRDMDLPLATGKPNWDVTAHGWGFPRIVQQVCFILWHTRYGKHY